MKGLGKGFRSRTQKSEPPGNRNQNATYVIITALPQFQIQKVPRRLDHTCHRITEDLKGKPEFTETQTNWHVFRAVI